MAQKIWTLKLEPYDDAVSVRDRLTFAPVQRVLLVWPSQGRVLTRKLDLLLVQRQATALGLRIALVTEDFDVLDHARELNISAFENATIAVQSRWKEPRDKVFVPPPRDEDEQAKIAERVVQMRGGPATLAERRLRQVARWIMFIVLVGSLLGGVLLTMPSATVSLTPASRQIFETVTIIADPNLPDIDIEHYQMPAQLVTLQATARVTVEATGVEAAGATRAQGLVTFRNTTGEPVLIPRGTVVATSATFPVRFETLIETTLPAGDGLTVNVPVQALPHHAGVEGNVGAGRINRVEATFAAVVTVTNINATYGGAIQEVKTVTQYDHDHLLDEARKQVKENARDLLLHQLSGDQFLVPGSITIIAERPDWTIYSAIVGDLTDSVTIDFRAEVQAVVVDERMAQQVAYAGLAPYIQPGLQISQQALSFTRGDIIHIEPSGRVTFLMTVRGNIAVAIDADRVRDRLTGLSVDDAHRRLNNEFLLDVTRPPTIDTWPPWFDRLPWLPVRIIVKVNAP